MSYLNAHNIVYKNLNPNNIFLDDFLFPKIFNFTFSDTLQNSFEKVQIAPKYCAPELFKDESIITQSSIIYSFALIMYEIISGNKIFDGQTVFQIMNSPKYSMFVSSVILYIDRLFSKMSEIHRIWHLK